MPSSRIRHGRSADRGQTGIDFLVGAAVFLIAVGFVFAFLPTMFDPFVGTGTSNALVADRSAAHLAENALVDPAKPAILDENKTDEFFNDTCEPDTIDTALGIDTERVQVEIPDRSLECGDDPPAGASVTVSQRVVLDWDGELQTVYVRVW